HHRTQGRQHRPRPRHPALAACRTSRHDRADLVRQGRCVPRPPPAGRGAGGADRMKTPNTRALAAQCLARVVRGASLDDVLARPEAGLVADAPFLKALIYGALRDWSLLGWIVGRLLDRPLSEDLEL